MIRYEIQNLRPNKATWEVVAILDCVLKSIQLQRRSPNVKLHVFVGDEGGAYGFIATGPDSGMSRRLFQMSMLKNGHIQTAHMKRWQEVAYGYSTMQHQEMVSLHNPDSIERIRGMVEKSCRVYANAMVAKARARSKKDEQSSARRGSRPRVVRPAGRFSSV